MRLHQTVECLIKWHGQEVGVARFLVRENGLVKNPSGAVLSINSDVVGLRFLFKVKTLLRFVLIGDSTEG